MLQANKKSVKNDLISLRDTLYTYTLQKKHTCNIVICRTHNIVKYVDVQNKNIAFIKDFFKLYVGSFCTLPGKKRGTLGSNQVVIIIEY